MKKALFLIAIPIFLLPIWAISQAPQQGFSDKPDEFIKQLGEFVNLGKREDVAKTFKEFEVKFKGLGEKEQQRVMTTCITMKSLNMNAMPFFSDYMQCINIAEVVDKDNSVYSQWQGIVESMIKDIQNRRFEPLRRFFEFSKFFLLDNTLYHVDLSTNWVTTSRDFTFRYANGNPSVEWQKLNLVARYKNDSIEILSTKGVLYPLTNQWKGVGGMVTWERLGSKDIHAELLDYTIDLTKGFYKAEKVKLRYPQMFPDRDVEGTFEEKLSIKNDNIEGSYPRFESYDKKLKINNIGGNIQFEGGFRLHGLTVYGFGTRDQKARLTMNDTKRGHRNFRAAAEDFIIKKGESIWGERVESVIYFGKDSLYHPSVNLRLDFKKNEMTLERSQRGGDRNPFFNSYHQVNMDFGKIRWYTDKDSMIVGDKYPGFGINNNNGLFESLQFFSDPDYRRFQNIATRNPISVIKMYADQLGKRTVQADELARQFDKKMDAGMIQSLLFDLVSQGFINYDVNTQMIELKDKIFHYVASNAKKSDFDVLRIISETKKENSVFNLRDTSILVNGVKGVEISNKQKVRVSPENEEVVLKKNRDFDFNGRVASGSGIFFGKNYHFEYNPFTIKMDSTKYLDLYLKIGEDKFGRPIQQAINSRLENLKGVLMIDAPNNKSGREDIPMFPSFQTKDYSYVYYDDKNIQDSVYTRDSFYFRLDRFNLDGMDSLKGDDLKFRGTMYSADIFPTFKETLVLQQDSSLGFKTKTPDVGYPTYRGRGKFTGDITLSNKGMLGVGVVQYFDASISSGDMVFQPKLMKASAKTFDLKENRARNTPEVHGTGIDINWKPYLDSMYLTAGDSAFKFFPEQTYTLRSTIVLTPNGVKGKGTFDWDKGTLTSDMFSFGSRSVQSDSMNMSIRALDKSSSNELAFDTRNIKGKIDFDEQRGRFKANSDLVQTFMPGVKYKTSINEFEWDLKEEDIDFKSNGQESTFLCIDPEQDSLKFSGTKASYDLKTNFLKVGGVPSIQTCDAYIYPDKENVQIELGGKMTTLENAKIVCDTLTKHHVINKAKVNIRGKKLYDASGFYEYNVGNKQQEIKFDNIIGERVGKGSRSEKRTETRATGEVADADSFKIDLKTMFKGTIALFSTSKNLKFEGFAKLKHENLPDHQWFSINCFANKADLALTISNPKNEEGEPLHTGIYISKENSASYPRVMMPLTFRKDRQIIDVRGIMKYQFRTDELVFGDSARVLNTGNRGSRLVYNNKNGIVTADGKLNIGSGLQYIKVKSAGRAKTNFLPPTEEQSDSSGVKTTPLSIDAMIGLDMFVPDKLLKIMAADIQAGSFDATDTDYKGDDITEKALAEFVTDSAEYVRTVANMKDKTLELPDRYNKFNFVFSKVPMKWNRETQSFITTKKVDLNSVAGININKQMTSYMEFRMPSNEDDRVYIYIKTSNDFFYFFGYQRGILSITSNNTKLEEEFNKIKPKERIKKMDDNQPFEIQWVETGTAEMFLRRIQNAQK